MSASLDNQTAELFNEIVTILTSIWDKYSNATLVAYLPLEGPMSYTCDMEGHTVKGLFKGDYNKRVLKNLVNQIRKDSNSSIQVSSVGLYSYKFSTVV